ncbi:hypothetical protein QTP88_012625 [Uroleucon formosanum]
MYELKCQINIGQMSPSHNMSGWPSGLRRQTQGFPWPAMQASMSVLVSTLSSFHKQLKLEKWLKRNIKSDNSTLTSSIRIPETDISSSTTSKRKNEFLPANNKKKTSTNNSE